MDYPGKHWVTDMMDDYAYRKYKEELEWLYEEIKEHQRAYAELQDDYANLESIINQYGN